VKFTVNAVRQVPDRLVVEDIITQALAALDGDYRVEIQEYETDWIYKVRISGAVSVTFYFTKRGGPVAEQIRRNLKATMGRSALH
jgi:metal-sulfur cluster biosynthetic enzyme